jgi:hypothetical protein
MRPRRASPNGTSERCLELVGKQASAFVKENFRMLTPPSRAARPIFTDHNSEPHASATVAIIAALT